MIKVINESNDYAGNYPNGASVTIAKYSYNSGTYIKSTEVEDVIEISYTPNYFYLTLKNGKEFEYSQEDYIIKDVIINKEADESEDDTLESNDEYENKKIKVYDIDEMYGPSNNRIVEFYLNEFINYFNNKVTGDPNSRYMVPLFRHNVSGYRYDKLIFSNSLDKCKSALEDYTNIDQNAEHKPMWDQDTYYAFIYDLENNKIVKPLVRVEEP